MNRIRRIAAAAAIAATLIGGSATAASATAPTDRLSHGFVSHAWDDVQLCIDALEYTRVPSDQPQSDLDDRAVILCGEWVDTKPEAKRLYRWAHRPAHRWALRLIG